MNARLLIVLSLALNVALGMAVLMRAPRPAPPAPRVAKPPLVGTTLPAAVMVAVPVAEVFDWSRLAAADLKKYRDNLRAVGCPGWTVRDIITAEVNAQFRERRRALVADLQRRFWEIVANKAEYSSRFGAAGRASMNPLWELSAERRALLTEVLSDVPYQSREELQARLQQAYERPYVWLPAEKRAQMVALVIEFAARRAAIDEDESLDDSNLKNPAALRKALDEEIESRRGRILSPEELAELKLRNSHAAYWAERLEGFEPSEAEWRAVAAQRMEYDNKLYNLDKETPDCVRVQMEAEWQTQLKKTLGEDRYSAYQLAEDGSYKQTRRITQRFGLADSVAAQTFEMQKAAQEAANQLREDKSLDAAARQAALTAIQQETQRSMEATLGANVFRAYRKYNGDWLKKLSPPPEE